MQLSSIKVRMLVSLFAQCLRRELVELKDMLKKRLTQNGSLGIMKKLSNASPLYGICHRCFVVVMFISAAYAHQLIGKIPILSDLILSGPR